MRRQTILLPLIAVVLAAATGSASAAPPQIRDKAGDWAVPSQDITAGHVGIVGGKLQADLQMAAAPAAGVRTLYAVIVYAGCVPYSLEYSWNGTAAASSARLAVYRCDPSDAQSVQENVTPVATYPATATVTAAGVRITTALRGPLHAGQRVGAAAVTEMAATIVLVGLDSGDATVGGDIAYAAHKFTL